MKRSDMTRGDDFAVRVTYPGHGPVCPKVEVRKRMNLVDFRDGGRAVMAEDVVGYDLPPERPGRKVVKRTVLHEVRLVDVLAGWETWQAGEKVKTRSGGLALAPPPEPDFELIAAEVAA